MAEPEVVRPASAPSSRRANSKRADARPTHGDTTGSLAYRQNREQAAEVREAQKRMSTVSPVGPYDDVDPIDLSDEAVAEREAAEYEASQQVTDLSTGGLTIEALPRERPRSALRSVSADGAVDPNEIVEVRSNGDYPETTLGKDPDTGIIRNVDFEANVRYRVPRWVADHLADKDMIY